MTKKMRKESLRQVYQLIAAHGRKVRKRKGKRELIENRELKVIPTSIPRGNYFLVYQATQICRVIKTNPSLNPKG